MNKLASIKVSVDYNLAHIAETAGQSDIEKRRYVDGHLIVEDVTQQALEGALAQYDDDKNGLDPAIMNRRQKFDDAENKGELPKTLHDHMDLIYKAFEKMESAGVPLPAELSDVIKTRIQIKKDIPKK